MFQPAPVNFWSDCPPFQMSWLWYFHSLGRSVVRWLIDPEKLYTKAFSTIVQFWGWELTRAVYCNDDKKGRLKTFARFSLLVKMSSSIMTDGIRVLWLALLPISLFDDRFWRSFDLIWYVCYLHTFPKRMPVYWLEWVLQARRWSWLSRSWRRSWDSGGVVKRLTNQNRSSLEPVSWKSRWPVHRPCNSSTNPRQTSTLPGHTSHRWANRFLIIEW